MAYTIHCPVCGRDEPTPYQFTKYCSWECYSMREATTETQALIRSLGGVSTVAEETQATERAVRSWYKQGVPYHAYGAIIKLAKSKRVAGVSWEWLDEISAKARAAYQARLTGRKPMDKRRVPADRVEVRNGEYVVMTVDKETRRAKRKRIRKKQSAV